MFISSVAPPGAIASSVTNNTNWWKSGFDLGNTGYNPNETVLGSSNVSSLVEAWSSSVGAGTPAVVNGALYVEWGSANVSALRASTGAELWTQSTGSTVCCGGNLNSPAVFKGVVYATLYTGVFAMKASSGAVRWKFAGASFGSDAAAVANGKVYAGGADGTLYALKASTGKKLWSFAAGTGSISSSAAVANGVVYLGGYDGNIYALNGSTGAELWRFTTGGTIATAPAVVNGSVYVGSDDGDLYALNASTGAELWRFTTGGSQCLSSPAVANGVVYVGEQDGPLRGRIPGPECHNRGGGVEHPIRGLRIASSRSNGVVYVSELNSQSVYAFHATTGAELWSPGTFVTSYPVIAGGVLYVGVPSVRAFRLP